MRTFMISALLLSGLAACGGASSDKDKLVEACLADDGGTREQCTCFADAAEESLEPALLSKLADAVDAGDEASAEMMDDMSPEEGMALMGFVMSVGAKCNLDM